MPGPSSAISRTTSSSVVASTRGSGHPRRVRRQFRRVLGRRYREGPRPGSQCAGEWRPGSSRRDGVRVRPKRDLRGRPSKYRPSSRLSAPVSVRVSRACGRAPLQRPRYRPFRSRRVCRPRTTTAGTRGGGCVGPVGSLPRSFRALGRPPRADSLDVPDTDQPVLEGAPGRQRHARGQGQVGVGSADKCDDDRVEDGPAHDSLRAVGGEGRSVAEQGRHLDLGGQNGAETDERQAAYGEGRRRGRPKVATT